MVWLIIERWPDKRWWPSILDLTPIHQFHLSRERAITSLDWIGYPILTFNEIPPIEVVLLDQPNQPSLGAGEGTVGPSSAALVNAVSQVVGKRMRDLPLTPQRIQQKLAG